jgi:hypothetical protein
MKNKKTSERRINPTNTVKKRMNRASIILMR